MKTIDFFGHNTGRLILGSNPYMGFSYITHKISRDEMMDYYTADNVVRDLKYAESLGYTTLIASSNEFTARYYRQYRNEGGKLKWIAQTHVPLDIKVNVNHAVEGGAIAIFHQGTSFDGLLETNQIDVIKNNLDELRRANIPVGIATHVPEHVYIAEAELNVDFYMTCLHNMRRNNEGRVSSSISGLKNEPHYFVYEDRELMFKAIRSTDKPCIAYKILAGGNYAFNKDDLRQCFVETYANIKPNDFATVGVFQRDKDQIRENLMLVEEILKGE